MEHGSKFQNGQGKTPKCCLAAISEANRRAQRLDVPVCPYRAMRPENNRVNAFGKLLHCRDDSVCGSDCDSVP
eukprot:57854-Rhodomonas_salina.5